MLTHRSRTTGEGRLSIRLACRSAVVVLAALPFMPGGAPPGVAAARAANPLPALPFNALYTERFPLVPCTPQACTFPTQGAGVASVIGPITETTGLTLALGTGTRCAPAKSQTTMTGATGEQIAAAATGQTCRTAIPGLLTATLTFTITGGTGRFKIATGSGTETGVVYFGSSGGSASFIWKGSITLCPPCASAAAQGEAPSVRRPARRP